MTTISNDDSSGRVLSEQPALYNILSDAFTELEEIPSAGYNRLVCAQRYGKRFVLKGLKPEYDTVVYRSLLSKEFEIMVQMNHPNVVRVYSLEEVEGVGLCIVMDYVDGQPLDRWLATKPSKALRQRVVGQLLDAMSYWHSLQIVHRDLKPSNILVTRNGSNLRVIDFGLADADQYTAFKEPAYTLAYASPEQMSNNGNPIDCRSDIYSFGRLLRLLFPHRHRLVVARCCRHNRQQRYASAVAVRRALRRGPILSAALLSLLLAATVIIVFNTIHHNSAPFPYVVCEGQVLRVQIVDSEAVLVGADTLVGDLKLPERVRHGLFSYPLRAIGDKALENCKQLTHVDFPSTLRHIGDDAFSGCTALTDTLILPEGLTTIGVTVFTDCEKIKVCRVNSRRLHLKKEDTPRIGRFHNTVNMHTVIIDGGVDSLCEKLFYYAYSGINHIVLEEGLTHLGTGCFSDLYNLERIDFPSTLRCLDASCFYGCGLYSLVLPEGIERIEAYALACLYQCRYLEIGPHVRYIGSNALYSCNVMDTIRFRCAEPPEVEQTFMGRRKDGRYPVIAVPAASLDRYLADSNFAKLNPVGY